jgi:hypothetical protein
VIGPLLGSGVLLLLIGAGALFYARSQKRKRGELASAETIGCNDLATLHGGTSAETGPGLFAHRCEVVGAAQPAQGEPVAAPLSGQPSVWHRQRVTHKYWERRRERDPNGGTRTRRVERSRVMADETSSVPFAIDDGTGRVLVDPRDAEMDRIEQSVDQFEPDTSGSEGGATVSAFGFSVQLGADSGSIGFQREEWVIRPGARLYVLGEASDRTGTLVMGKPSDGRLLISTRTEEEIAAASEKRARIAGIAGGIAAAAGVALIVAGAVSAVV